MTILTQSSIDSSVDGKVCSICKQWRPFSEFAPNPTRRDRHTKRCNHCGHDQAAYSHTSYLRNKEKQAERQRERLKDPVKRARHYLHHVLARHRARAKKFGVPATLTIDEWIAILDQYGRACCKCGATDAEMSVDHIVPLSLGGGHTKENVQPLCTPCNSQKSLNIVDYRFAGVVVKVLLPTDQGEAH